MGGSARVALDNFTKTKLVSGSGRRARTGGAGGGARSETQTGYKGGMAIFMQDNNKVSIKDKPSRRSVRRAGRKTAVNRSTVSILRESARIQVVARVIILSELEVRSVFTAQKGSVIIIDNNGLCNAAVAPPSRRRSCRRDPRTTYERYLGALDRDIFYSARPIDTAPRPETGLMARAASALCHAHPPVIIGLQFTISPTVRLCSRVV
ncbi:hypothetical protein EVAR_34387_1 [Eumeta japonica]|uniref:Uncharacterized protein n=1 Tax=Eumeta variegata TaxID=151549 RepID=A0A4C1WXC6_EUMVA|nr:hypothetical protein EVAR_34387_1 [Eumeta japonica]